MKKYIPFRMTRFPLSFLLDRRTAVVTGILLLLTFAAMVISLGSGTKVISPWNVIKVLFGFGSGADELIVNKLRMPRILVGVMVGSSLAVAGAILQGMIRNPLASPDIIGITGGASVTAVVFLSTFTGASIHLLPLAAFCGAFVVTLGIYLLAWKSGVSPVRLVLIGVGIGTTMSALTTLSITTMSEFVTNKALIWMTGSIYGASWKNVLALLPWTVLFLPLSLIFARNINLQMLGDDVAAGAGSRVQRDRLLLLFICVALAGSAVAFGGAIGFVGLIAPHMARKLVGPSFGGLLPVTALLGSFIVVVADWLGRTAFPPLDLPVGLFTSLIGAPFFIYLLVKERNQ
ncbi:iron ABC transporter permease [Paenibacillus sp. J31TS4]|uniref:FecCD family ABC transporter permease n=1 Tax=Paenibacillus sp. J31TS4 TaxID=2807195 RepID=UPI001B194676|nr:iron ABC transporter permease [Paenibacillus sp. J31TS4]GIP37642.1 iron ABC transporter permease [Paenibacillus sp. J31TS4]